MEKYVPLNFALLKHPMNWFIVVTMVLFAGVAVDVVLTYLSKGNSNAP